MSNAQCKIVIAVQYRFSLLSEYFSVFFSFLRLASTYELKTLLSFVPFKVRSNPEGILWVCTNSALEGDRQLCLWGQRQPMFYSILKSFLQEGGFELVGRRKSLWRVVLLTLRESTINVLTNGSLYLLYRLKLGFNPLSQAGLDPRIIM